MKRMTYQEKLEIQKPIMMMIWEALPEKKRKTFEAAEYRNRYLTSEYMLRNGRITTYIEGWYLELEGCQSRFAVFAKELMVVLKSAESQTKTSSIVFGEWSLTIHF